MASKYRKVLIIPYFGQFPNYFNLWLNSCSYNKDYNFYIYTDINTIGLAHPDNVRFIDCTLDKIREKASRIIGFDVALERPYKLCDYRPCYGAIFYDDIKDFDFWGYCDIDLIFGDISRFLPDEVFDSYDKILTCGHFTLLRNTPYINKIFKEDKYQYYKTVYSTDESCLFDEGAFKGYTKLLEEKGVTDTNKYHRKFNINSIFSRAKLNVYVNFDIYADIDAFYDDLRIVYGSETSRNDIYRKKSVFYYSGGRVFRKYMKANDIFEMEYMYIHLQKRPMMVNASDSKRFLILKHSFENFPEKFDMKVLNGANKDNTKLSICVKADKLKIAKLTHYFLDYFFYKTGKDIRYYILRRHTLLDEEIF